LLPDPAMMSTLPVRSSAAWIAWTWYFAGNETMSQRPLAFSYDGRVTW
jgi:hypothetical protein